LFSKKYLEDKTHTFLRWQVRLAKVCVLSSKYFFKRNQLPWATAVACPLLAATRRQQPLCPTSIAHGGWFRHACNHRSARLLVLQSPWAMAVEGQICKILKRSYIFPK
jgi:hypothetical protein